MSRNNKNNKEPKVNPAVKILALIFAVIMLVSLIVSFAGALPFGQQEEEEPIPLDWSDFYQPSSAGMIERRSERPQSNSAPLPQDTTPVLEFTEDELLHLDEMLNNWAAESEEEEENGHNVAVYFKDVNSGLEYTYNPEKKFAIASLNKAPYALYLYTLVEQGAANLDETFYITPAMVESSLENSGQIKNDPDLPRNYTLNEMLYYLLQYSDTAAMRILLQRYPANGFIEYARQLPLHYPDDIRELMNARICALDAGVYLQAMYQYMQEGEHGGQYKEHLVNASGQTMIRSEYPVANKYGWDLNAYHDMAVVFAPNPYILAILTDKDMGSTAERTMFATISQTFETMLNSKWQAL